MNEGRIWLYVKPTIGLPLFFLVWIAGTALMVHLSILYNTTWFADFWQGSAPRVAVEAPVMEAVAAPVAMEAAPAAEAAAPAAE